MLGGKLTVYIILTVGGTTIHLDDIDITDSTTYLRAKSECVEEVRKRGVKVLGPIEDNVKPSSIKVDLYNTRVYYECGYRGEDGYITYGIETKQGE